MTCREKLAIEHPDKIDPRDAGGCEGCPSDVGYMPDPDYCGDFKESCTACWDRGIPEEKTLAEVLPTVKDQVNHPGHYESGKFECIDVMLETQGKEAVMGFCICNAFKYLYRHTRKNGIEDVKKAVWYLNKYFELAEEENDD